MFLLISLDPRCTLCRCAHPYIRIHTHIIMCTHSTFLCVRRTSIHAPHIAFGCTTSLFIVVPYVPARAQWGATQHTTTFTLHHHVCMSPRTYYMCASALLLTPVPSFCACVRVFASWPHPRAKLAASGKDRQSAAGSSGAAGRN
jgi:hypothetical protein